MDTYLQLARLIEALQILLETIKLITLGVIALYLVLACLIIVCCRREIKKGNLNAAR
jgi:hypothetical protein